jgi:hypothetical protein
MAYPSPQAPDLPARRSRPGGAAAMAKQLAGTLWFPLLFFFGFLTYLLAFHGPAPHDVKIAVAGPVSVTQIGTALQEQAPGAFEVIPVQDDEQARQQVLDQAAQAAYVATGTQATFYTARADGALLEQSVTKAITPIAQEEHLSLRTVELVPTVPGDVTGNSIFYLGLSWNVGAYFLVVGLVALVRAPLGRPVTLAVIAGMGVFASIAGFLIAYGLGAVPGQALAILYGFLAFEAVALTVFGLASFTGKYTLGVAAALFVFLSIPSSGGTVPYQMVPIFFGWVHPVMPLGNLVDALRGIFYFDGTNMIRPTLVLCAWITVGAALITASAQRQRARQRQTPAAGEAAEAGSRSLPELLGPVSAVAEPAALQPSVSYAQPSGNGSHSFGRRPPMLFGKVTETAGAPLSGANITIIDAHGHQLLRTSTDLYGRYAADGLPRDILTILVSVPGRMPSATRITLASDLPVRHDFVISADSTQGIAVFE